MQLTFTALEEAQPGQTWAELFRTLWPAYRRWWLSQGESSRPSFLECRKAIQMHLPELEPLYQSLCELAGGGDVAARFLSVYRPPPYLSGCSQAAWVHGEPLLVRNYDYSPLAFDAVILHSQWLGRRVMGMSDSLIGLLDGINEDGLAVSLTFGGRRVIGDGFGIPIVLRYILETCGTIDQAVSVLQRVPCHMAYNVTLLDAQGCFKTVFVSPDRQAFVSDAPAATNHQRVVEWHEHARTTSSVERQAFLLHRLQKQVRTPQRFIAAFQRPPLYSVNFDGGFGTLYTAVYHPQSGGLELRWPGLRWALSLNGFQPGTRNIEYP